MKLNWDKWVSCLFNEKRKIMADLKTLAIPFHGVNVDLILSNDR